MSTPESSFGDIYELKGAIGFPGSYGEVLECIERDSKRAYAVKLMQKPAGKRSRSNATRSKLLANEIAIMGSVRHPNIVSTQAIFETDRETHIVMEKCSGGDLFDRVIQNGGRIPEQQAKVMLKDLLLALDHLHRQGIVHCDIKLSNVMFADSTPNSLKLIDFGMSQLYDGVAPLTDPIGTLNYQAPEIIKGSYGFEVDLWSVGVVLFVMLFGYNPFDPFSITDSHRIIHMRVLAGFAPETRTGYGAFFPLDMFISSDARDLITRLLVGDPAARLTTQQALAHPWFNDANGVKAPHPIAPAA